MIHIDGSHGEGGGQVLRSSLALSMATGRAFRISSIRAGRAKPGLMRQHLTCVQAAAAVCGAEVHGDAVGSREVTFTPGPVRAGSYRFAVGTAGGTSLVLQAIVPALLRAQGPSTIIVEGGTHNTFAPPFEFVERALLPLLGRAGAAVRARIERHGFYPAGGGRVIVEIEPATAPTPLALEDRGGRLAIRAGAIVSMLSRSIAVRELQVLCDRLGIGSDDAECIELRDAAGPGNAVFVELRHEHVTEVFSSVGRLGKSAEEVARELADEVRAYIAARCPVGPYLADQLMVPLAVLAGGRFSTGPLTPHATTNMATLAAFGGVASADAAGMVHVSPLWHRASAR